MKIRRPDDMHVHLRDGYMLRHMAQLSARHFARALVMPNTTEPIRNGLDVEAYRTEIKAAAPTLEPLMTIKLTDQTTEADIRSARAAGAVAAKLYPVGVTTNSADGVFDPCTLMPLFEVMAEVGMVLSLHGESPEAFCLDREEAFLKDLNEIVQAVWTLKVVLEHVTTAKAIFAVQALGENVAATITVHHLFLTLDDVIGDMLKPHHFCKPIAKRPEDRRWLREMATRGGHQFFLGTDSAPHTQRKKECPSGCAGVFTAPLAMPLLATLFEELGHLDSLEAFTSEYGARFYGLPPNQGTLELVREPMHVPAVYGEVVPFFAGKTLPWSVP